MRYCARVVSRVVLLFVLFWCWGTASVALAGKEKRPPFKVGVIAGPETDLMKVAKKVAWKRCGLRVKIVRFTDYVMPNLSLSEGSIDANMFQHRPYLVAMMKHRHLGLISVGHLFIYPMGLYSKRIKRLVDLKRGATVALPNDPSNEARALLLLQKAGLIRLKAGGDALSGLPDVVQNEKHLHFRLLDAAFLPRVLADVDVAAINTNYAMLVDLLPQRDALEEESREARYANILVVREAQRSDPRVRCLLTALHSKAVRMKAKRLFKGAAIPAWVHD